MFEYTSHNPQREYSRERVENGLAPVHGDGCQCEHADRYGQHVYEWAEGAHERRQIPPLQ